MVILVIVLHRLAKAYGIEVDVLQSEWGKRVDVELVKEKLAAGAYKAVTVTHADTSTGVSSDLDALIPIIKAGRGFSNC